MIHYYRSLGNEDLEYVSECIVAEFKHECLEAYYVDPVPKKLSRSSKSERSKGKIVDKYRNKNTFIRNAYNLEENANKKIEKVPTEICSKIFRYNDINFQTVQKFCIFYNELVDSQALESKKWLIDHRNENELLSHWNLSQKLRILDAENKEYRVINNFYENWPILKESTRYNLVYHFHFLNLLFFKQF